MNQVNIWHFTNTQITQGHAVVLMCVFYSRGSSPGRQGFKMAVSADGTMYGSIGGGIMEHKLVELSRSRLKKNQPFLPFIKHQIHQENMANKSGMICSGEQTVAFYHLGKKDLEWLSVILNSNTETKSLTFDQLGVKLEDGKTLEDHYSYQYQSEEVWNFQELLGHKNKIYIIGGGHVGLALSTMMRNIGFYVTIFDDRSGLNTLEENRDAHEKKVVEFEKVGELIPEHQNAYVVIVSFGYKTDGLILRQLVNKKYAYLGMMGSEKKTKVLFDELIKEGFAQADLNRVHAPIGLPIKSKTPEEIAVSIASQIIQIKNA